MPSRENIICFAKDWNEDPTSNHHVMIEMARTHKVLWLNSVATRTPNLSSGRDVKKIVRKLGEFASGPVNVENDLWVFTPLVLPLPHSPVARRINQQILRATIRTLRMRLGMRASGGTQLLWNRAILDKQRRGDEGRTALMRVCLALD